MSQITLDGDDFVDYAAFYVAVDAVDEILAQAPKEGEVAPDTLAGVDWIGLATQREEARVLLRRVASSFDQGMETILGEALEKANLRVKTRFQAALRGNPVTRYQDRARFLTETLPRLNAHTGVITDVLSTSHGKMMLLIRATSADNPAARLLAVASVRPASGKNALLKRWQMASTGLCGNSVPDYEETATDVQAATVLAEGIRNTEILLQGRERTDAAAADLVDQQAEMRTDLREVISEASDPGAVKAAVAQKMAVEKKYVTKVAASIEGGLTPAGEECVTSRGKGVIAAGAGSGKTRVLASKVVYHIQELGVPPAGIIAVSFSRKSAGELKRRVFDYAKAAGLSLDERARYQGMGTTHSIARMILNQAGYKISASPQAPEAQRAIEGSDITTLMKVAIEQVKMAGGKDKTIPKDAMSFFPYLPGRAIDDLDPSNPGGVTPSPVPPPVQAPVMDTSPLAYYLADEGRFKQLIETAQKALTQAVISVSISATVKSTTYGPKTVAVVQGPGIQQFAKVLNGLSTVAGKLKFEPANPKYYSPDRYIAWGPPEVDSRVFVNQVQDAIGFGNIQNARKALGTMANVDPGDLSPDQMMVLQTIITQPLVASALEKVGKTATREVVARPDDIQANIESVSENQSRSLKENRKGPYYYWMNNPANQWFNLGAPDSAFEVEDEKGNKVPAPLAVFTRYQGRVKNSMVAPGEAYTKSLQTQQSLGDDDELAALSSDISPAIKAAVYGAYEWLKGNVAHLKGRLDHDDQLIQAARVLTENRSLLKKIRQQFKVVLVDEAQDLNKCVSGDTEVITPQGPVTVQDILVGTQVLSYDAGVPTYHRITAKAQSHWTRGYRIHLRSGRTLTMSPDHQIYATHLERVPQGQMALYLMYREGMGFRLGTSTRPFHSSQGGSAGRAQAEKADAMWILEVGETEEILYKEQAYSLKYGVPTYIYEGFNHGCDQPRIDRLFQEFGENGRTLLGQYDLQFGLPHWTNQTNTRGRFNRRVVALNAHRANQGCARGSYVGLTWTGDIPEGCAVPVYRVKNDRNMINKYSRSYTEARETAQAVAAMFGGRVVENLSLQGETLPLMTASGLFEGMRVPVLDRESNSTVLDTINSIELVDGGSYFDITVEDASNFFGNEVLSHNCQHTLFGLIAGYLDSGTIKPRESGKMSADTYCFIGDDKQAIYEFRGADPDEFINKSDLVPNGEGFKTYILDTNYRSGSAIVTAANQLIAYNTKQIPMVCQSHSSRGEGKIVRKQVELAEAGPRVLVDRILGDLEEAKATGQDLKGFFKNYGLAVRTNGEVGQFAMAMIEAGIPFRSKKNFFGGPLLGPIVALFQLFDPSTNVEERNKCFLKGLKAPNFGVNPRTMADRLDSMRAGDYLAFLKAGDNADRIYPGMEFMSRRILAYLDYLQELEAIVKEGTSRSLLQFILEYRGPDGTNFQEQLASDVKNDAEEMEEVKQKAAEEGTEVSPEHLLEQALKPIAPIIKVAEKFTKSSDFVKYIDSLVLSNRGKNKTESEDIEGEADLVTVDTVHGWKGLETKHLFVPMSPVAFPHMKVTTDEDMASERRLAYVALTRGRESVTIIEPTARVFRGKTVPMGPSRFATEACIPVEGKAATPPVDDDSVVPPYQRVANLLAQYALPRFEVIQGNEDNHTEDLMGQWGDLLGGK